MRGVGASRGRIPTILGAALLVLLPTAAVAGDDDGGFGGNGDGDEAVIHGTDPGSTTETPGGNGNGNGQTVIRIPKPYTEYRYVPNCSANDAEGGADALCGAAVFTCPEGQIRYRVYTREHDADGSVSEGADWEARPGSVCRGADDPPEGGPVVITVADIADQARKAAPATVVHVEPVTKTFVNVPTNFYADAEPQDASVQVLGQTIALQFKPTGFAWSFGDGSSGSGAGVKDAAVGASGAVEHLYRRSADVQVTLTRTFAVTFTAPGGVTGTLPAPGVSNTSPPTALEVGEIQTVVTGGR